MHIIEEHAYTNANRDDFTWEDADVYPIDGNGRQLWGIVQQGKKNY